MCSTCAGILKTDNVFNLMKWWKVWHVRNGKGLKPRTPSFSCSFGEATTFWRVCLMFDIDIYVVDACEEIYTHIYIYIHDTFDICTVCVCLQS